MDNKQVVVVSLHSELESAYPPLNISVGAAATGAEVILAFVGDGIQILHPQFEPVPSEGKEYLAKTLADFGAPTIVELLDSAVDLGVQIVVPDSAQVESNWPFQRMPLGWILNKAANADLFAHF